MEFWKTDKFVKDDEERELLIEECKNFAGPIKNIWIQLAAKSSFPQVGPLDILNFATAVGIIDKNFTSGFLDNCFVAAINKPEAKKIKGLDGKLLMRYNFLELLCRVAVGKFYEPKIAET